jgi:hypothetical protein
MYPTSPTGKELDVAKFDPIREIRPARSDPN